MNLKLRIVIAIVTAVAIVGVVQYRLNSTTIQQQVEEAFERQDHQEIIQLVESQTELPKDSLMLWRVGLAYQKLGRIQAAIPFFLKAADTSPDAQLTRSIRMSLADLHEERWNFQQAIEALTPLTDLLEFDVMVYRRLAELYNRMGRRFEANQIHFKLVQRREHDLDDLILLGCRQDPYLDEGFEAVLNGADDESSAYRLSRALVDYRSGQLSSAEKRLTEEIEEHPAQAEAHALLGLVLVDRSQFESLTLWNQQLPETAEKHPDVWYVRGVWAESLRKNATAMRCFHRALSLDRHLQPAIFKALAHKEECPIDEQLRNDLTAHARLLESYTESCRQVFFEGLSAVRLKNLIDQCELLHRREESLAWNDLRGKLTGQLRGPLNSNGSESGLPTESTGQSEHPVRRLLAAIESQPNWADVSSFPINFSGWGNMGVSSEKQYELKRAIFASDQTAAAIDFVYDNGTDNVSGLMIQESMGGGVGVIDVDCDSWPDLFFPQGARKKNGPSDSLFRNLRGHEFRRIEHLAECKDSEFSHGIAVGDLNQDGFPDMVVSNSGLNHLYINNGDGTFEDRSHEFDTTCWSMSVAIADLNGDSLPDIFEANYLEGDRPFTEKCINQELQEHRTCPPERFQGESNQFYVNNGDGSFHVATTETGLDQWKGKSLGIVAGDFDADRSVELFIANDQVANEYLQLDSLQGKRASENPTTNNTGLPQFVESAVSMGVAYNGTGEALACMGIAAGDIDHNGSLDLFVTNFYRQENTLYQNNGAVGFRDITRESNLRESSLTMLGFGTQFLDANLDGQLDLVVGNGHLDDFTHKNIPYAMSPQLFLSTSTGQFVTSPADDADTWFQQKHLTRGIARLDWNRDGRPDIVASQIKETAALLTNQTTEANRLCLNLRGTASDRDAVGTQVVLQTGDNVQQAQVTAGDGYCSSNQKLQMFGLGQHQIIDRLTILWPSGLTQTFSQVDANQYLIAVEGLNRLMKRPISK